jgi:hypothetical protein
MTADQLGIQIDRNRGSSHSSTKRFILAFIALGLEKAPGRELFAGR